jgi:hypothetical protein
MTQNLRLLLGNWKGPFINGLTSFSYEIIAFTSVKLQSRNLGLYKRNRHFETCTYCYISSILATVQLVVISYSEKSTVLSFKKMKKRIAVLSLLSAFFIFYI